ncbi:hypothetical protein EPO33_00195 [Patescibacteria group bacterium]|nr:MAG: hypothetical protein EPO33_00195 [Patescibacteria group bacterium]
MRTGPNSNKRIKTKTARSTGRGVTARSMKARKRLIEQHTPQWWEKEVKKRGAVRCSACGAYFLKGHWLFVPATLEKKLVRIARGATCPACASERTRGVTAAEGVLVIKGLAADDRPLVLQTIAAYAARERQRNSETRVLSVDMRGAEIRVLTTQNHLAVRIGKKLNESRKGGKLEISYGSDDLPARAVWRAPKRT